MKIVDMETTKWGGRKIVSSRYSEFLLALEEYIDGRDAMLLEVIGNAEVQKLVASIRKEPNESFTVLKDGFLSKLLKFSLGTSFTLVEERELLKDIFRIAQDNAATLCVLSNNKNSNLSKKVARFSILNGRVKQLYSDTNSIDEMLQYLMSEGIDLVVSDIQPQIALSLRQTCQKKYRKNFVWIQLLNHEIADYQANPSNLAKGINWIKEGTANAVCAWKVVRFKPLINQGSR